MQKFSFRIKIICIAFTWLYSTFLITLQLFSHNGFVLEGMLTSCSFDYLSRDVYTRTYMLIMFIGGFIIPLKLILIFYILTKNEIKQKNKYFFRMNSTERSRTLNTLIFIEQESSTNDIGPVYQPEVCLACEHSKFYELKKKICSLSKKKPLCRQNTINLDLSRNYFYLFHREKRVLKRIILNVTFFCIAWLPYAIMALAAQFGNDIENYITPLTTSVPAVIAKVSSIYNPILYTLTHRDCKNYYRKLLQFKQRK
ncbi:unnamed protein product [Brachionus calyciflorus]|uniref:G-protein coupled receptors family 1 profile domain-containing protein n=1 Tax=Brachionus calyciflorus TaxID=104777 RepID=A0A813Q406_9BILA|nr:unnamed protein product [Brachionus calyciflorus]